MLNPVSSPATTQTPLTLKDVAHPSRKSRLLPCGTVNRKHSGLACKVFVKRTRSSADKVLMRSLQQPPQEGHKQKNGSGRQRSRRGSFLRLANRPQQLIEHA
jgi:hypothetical protein